MTIFYNIFFFLTLFHVMFEWLLVSFSCFILCFLYFFFFSSRRRHTRCGRDWSSDVCSSDLGALKAVGIGSGLPRCLPFISFWWQICRKQGRPAGCFYCLFRQIAGINYVALA